MPLKPAVFASLILLGTAGAQGLSTQSASGWRTYRSPEYGFAIDYPQTMSFYSGHPDLMEAQLSMIPICEDTTVACFEYNGKKHEDTSFGAVGVSINVLRDRRTEQDCAKIDTGSFPVKTQTIHGIRFDYGETGQVALGQSSGGLTYRTFHENVCFEINAASSGPTLTGYDPGTVKVYDSTKLNKLPDRMVRTFRFVGPVKDGPGWQVYRDNACGGSFEYPDGTMVRTIIEYSQSGFYSDELTCSRSFIYKGLEYHVAHKAELNGRTKVNEWLKRSGYPDLDRAKVVMKSGNYTMYSIDSYSYIVGQGGMYLLSVSDANHKVIIPRDDRVFTHLLNSFKAR